MKITTMSVIIQNLLKPSSVIYENTSMIKLLQLIKLIPFINLNLIQSIQKRKTKRKKCKILLSIMKTKNRKIKENNM